MEGDEAFYYLHRNGELVSGVITHVDNFTIAGTNYFIHKILNSIEDKLTISKVEQDNFRYTGQDISTAEDRNITIEKKDYIDSLEDIKEICQTD